MEDNKNIFYVYKWFFKSTGEVFHIGKGKENRYLEVFKDFVNRMEAVKI